MTPDQILECMSWIRQMTEDGRLVWRDKSGKIGHRVMKAYPSARIRTINDFEMLIGQRLAGALVGYLEPESILRFMLRDGTGETYPLDATPENDPNEEIRAMFDLAVASTAKNEPISPLVSEQ